MSFFGKLFHHSKKKSSPQETLPGISKENNNLVAFMRTMSDDLALAEKQTDQSSPEETPKTSSPFLEQAPEKAPEVDSKEPEIQFATEPAKEPAAVEKKPSMEHIAQSLANKSEQQASKQPLSDVQATDYAYEERQSLTPDSQPTDEELLAAAKQEQPSKHLQGLPGSYSESYPEIVTYQKKQHHPVLIGLGVFASLLLIAGGVLWWKIQTPEPLITDNALPPAPEPETSADNASSATTEEKMPSDSQSDESETTIEELKTLTFDSQTVTADQIHTVLLESGKKIIDDGAVSLQQFSVSDENNQPIAFSQFAQWFKINVPPQTLASLDDSFKLFLYNDGGDIRLGFILTPKDAQKTNSLFTIIEPQLFSAFSPVFLDIPKNTFLQDAQFNSSTYNEHTIRYANIPKPVASTLGSLSIDYTFADTQLVIGTSKQTVRAILDWVDQQTTSPESEKTAQ